MPQAARPPRGPRSGRRRVPPWKIASAVLAGLALIAMGVLLLTRTHDATRTARPAAAPLPAAPFSLDPSDVPGGPLAPVRAGQAAPRAADDRACDTTVPAARIVIPALCLSGPVVTTSGIRDGALVLPHNVHQVGMWDQGAGLTDQAGTTLLAGHVHYPGQGNGALYDLYRAGPGDAVYVSDARGEVTTWRIASLQVVKKSKLPASVFAGKSGPRRLVLVTCGGPVDYVPGYGNTYRDNVIATAVRPD
ncbi:class F sortase [Streptomyces sp. NPDC048637]|uniref:class F sortase n=1 Tax=Streptomyces sp. NPDC048637 TaxID=3155636 RepID=UPI003418CE81